MQSPLNQERSSIVLRAVLFDLDDTLCDSCSAFDAGLTAAFETLLAQRPDLDRARLRDLWREVHKPLFEDLRSGRMSMAQVRDERFRRLLRHLDVKDEDREDEPLSAELNMILGNVQLQHLRLFDDTDVLHRLRPRYHLSIVTNGADDRHPDSQRSKVVHLGLQERVDAVWISDSVGHRKPNASIFHAAASALNLPYAQILFVGDSPEADIRGAHAVGMTTAWLHRGSTWPAEITDIQPDYVLESLAGLPPLLEI